MIDINPKDYTKEERQGLAEICNRILNLERGNQTYDVAVTVRHQEIAGFDDSGEPIHQPKDCPRIYLEKLSSAEEAQRAADSAIRDNPDVVVKAWVQPAGELPDEGKAVQQQPRQIERSR